jgi:D-alanyl-D-alanine carboxypeptidase
MSQVPISKEQIYALPLGKKQRLFARMVAELITYAYSLGYEISFGDAYATTGHMPGSLHYVRLAIDLNLFKDGKYLDKSEDHLVLGEYWESKGGTWGGRFKDGNHYSLAHAGKK